MRRDDSDNVEDDASLDVLSFLLDVEAESMSGPIVRTGTTPEFWKNWDRAFGEKKQASGDKKAPKKTGKAEASGTAKKVVKSAVKKAAKKKKTK